MVRALSRRRIREGKDLTAPRRAVWAGVGALALVVLATAWFLANFDREFYESRGRPQPPAVRNAWLATQMLLERFGYRVETSQEASALDRLPPGGTVILSSERQYHLTPSRTAALLSWVDAGGLLIADASGVGREDPILKAFDVRLTQTPAEGERGEGADEEDEDAPKARETEKENDRAAGKKPRDAPRRTVAVPGYGRELRMRSSRWTLYPGNVEPAWEVAGETDKRGNTSYEILAFERGAGDVVLVNGLWRFGYRGPLARDDHAEILLAMIATHQHGGDVRILARLVTPSLFEWLWANARAFLAAAVVLFLLWLWRIIPRFGVLRPDPPRPRRSLIAHLRAVGRFLWRQEAAAVLLDAARANVKRKLVQRGLASAGPTAPSPVGELARAFAMSEADLVLALGGAPANDHQYVAAMATLYDLSRKLNEPAPN
jgi:hypothetical protein